MTKAKLRYLMDRSLPKAKLLKTPISIKQNQKKVTYESLNISSTVAA